MYVTDIRHFLTPKGDIAPLEGQALRMAQFITAVIAHETDMDSQRGPGPVCFKCEDGAVRTSRGPEALIQWHCPACLAEGVVSNWVGCFWDVSEGFVSG